jgi:hypothetical protein
MKGGLLKSDRIYTAEEAKARWPAYADKIDAALARVAAQKAT